MAGRRINMTSPAQCRRGLQMRYRLEYLPLIGKAADPDVLHLPDVIMGPLMLALFLFAILPAVAAPQPEHIQRMLEALRTISNSHKAAESYAALLQGQRNRLIAELAEAKLTLREIAPWAGMHHTRIGRILKRPIPDERYLLLTPEIPDWNFVTPEEVTRFLTGHYATGPPPTNAEIQALLDDHAEVIPALEGNAPAWPWWKAQAYDVFGRAISDRTSVHRLEILSVARVMMLSAVWRAADSGRNQAPELLERGLNLATRLLVQITAQVDSADT